VRSETKVGDDDELDDNELIEECAAMIESMHARGEITLTEDELDQLDGRPRIEICKSAWEESQSRMIRRELEWIDPLDAVYLVAPSVGGDANAKLAILARLHDRAIECTMTWLCVQPDIGPIPFNRPRVSDAPTGPHEAFFVSKMSRKPNGVRLGAFFWGPDGHVNFDLPRCSWSAGLFVTTHPFGVQDHADTGSRKRVVATGVRFAKCDVERIIGIKSRNDDPTSAGDPVTNKAMISQVKPSVGRKRSHDWENWIAEAIIYVRMYGVDLTQSNQEFYDEIAGIMMERNVDVPDFPKVARAISAIKTRWREALASGEIAGRQLS